MNHRLHSNQCLLHVQYSFRPLEQLLLLTADVNHEENLKNGRTDLREGLTFQGTFLAGLSNCG